MSDWNITELIRGAYCWSLAFSFLILLPGNFKFVRSFGEMAPTLRVLGRLNTPRFSASTWLGISCLFVTSLILCGASIAPQLSALTCLVSYFLCFSQLAIVDTAKRKTFSIPVVLSIFALEPWMSADWVVFILQAIACQVLLSSGLQKIRHSGFQNWFSGRALRSHLLRESLLSDSRTGSFIASHPQLCAALATVVIVFEIGFVAALFTPPAITICLVVAALAFHFAIWRVMKINYLPFHGPVYWVFLPAFLALAERA